MQGTYSLYYSDIVYDTHMAQPLRCILNSTHYYNNKREADEFRQNCGWTQKIERIFCHAKDILIGLMNKKNVDVYVTGSNSRMLLG